MRVETKLFDEKGATICNTRKGENSAFFYFDFEVIPRPGEMVLIHGDAGGFYVVSEVSHIIAKGRSCPFVVLEKLNGQTRQSVLQRHGWIPGDEATPNAFELVQSAMEN